MKKVKGKLNKDGVLEIERAGKFKKADCRHDRGGIFCTDDCSLFQEPEEMQDGTTALMLCSALWHFIEFEDER